MQSARCRQTSSRRRYLSSWKSSPALVGSLIGFEKRELLLPSAGRWHFAKWWSAHLRMWICACQLEGKVAPRRLAHLYLMLQRLRGCHWWTPGGRTVSVSWESGRHAADIIACDRGLLHYRNVILCLIESYGLSFPWESIFAFSISQGSLGRRTAISLFFYLLVLLCKRLWSRASSEVSNFWPNLKSDGRTQVLQSPWLWKSLSLELTNLEPFQSGFQTGANTHTYRGY